MHHTRNETTESDLLSLTARIVADFAGNNTIAGADLPELLRSVHRALQGLRAKAVAAAPKPAVPIRKSVTPNYLVCLEDGKKLKMLKRHLRSVYGMTPLDYRRKWNLPNDYPMVAPNYAAQRAQFAKSIGLGKSSSPGRKRRVK